MQRFIILVCLLVIPASGMAQSEQRLEVKVSGVRYSGKPLYLAVFRPQDGFPKEEGAWKHTSLRAEAGEAVAYLDIPYGEYAIAVFLDENGNGRLDKNLIGFPKEQFGFSNNFRPRTGPPKFRNCSFVFSEANMQIAIRLLK